MSSRPDPLTEALPKVHDYVRHVTELYEKLHRGEIKVSVPQGLIADDRPLAEAVATHLPESHRLFQRVKSQALFRSLPVVFDVENAVGPYLATADRDPSGQPYRFMDLSQMIATHASGENDPFVASAVLCSLPMVVAKYTHCEYQTTLSLRIKEELEYRDW